ncbi:MAG: hypothetical protein K6A32_01960 [Bacteroidales bacterium]|nr:hypothetical protein [Bacteroidales bacterium]
MTIVNEQTTNQMSQLFEQARRYFTLQKDYLSLKSVEVLTRLFSTIALAIILILVGFLVVLFGSFALAYWIGELLGSSILGFAIITGALLLGACLVYANRKAWIILPTTRFMVELLASKVNVPTEEGIALEKTHLQQQLNDSQGEIRDTANTLLAPLPQARNRWEVASHLFQNGMTIFRVVQVGFSAYEAARRVFGIGRRKKRF